jgi:hypothetical protein
MTLTFIKDQLLLLKYLHKMIFNLKISVKRQRFKTDTQIRFLRMKIILRKRERNNKDNTEELFNNRKKLSNKGRKMKNKWLNNKNMHLTRTIQRQPILVNKSIDKTKFLLNLHL